MGEKAEQKRIYILNQAKRVFAEKGFKNVTMKDIITACNISRGGIYLYFNNTSEIFEAILQSEKAFEQSPGVPSLPDYCNIKEQLKAFLDLQKNELLNPDDSLITATYEYLFMKHESLNPLDLRTKFDTAVNQLSGLIQHGVEQGEFSVNPDVAAQNIVLLLEGLRISSTVLELDKNFIDRQMDYVLSMLNGGK